MLMIFSKLLAALSASGQTGTAKSESVSVAEERTGAKEKMTLEYAKNVLEQQPTSEDRLMTDSEAKKMLCEWCLSQVGYQESLDGSNKYADGVWDKKLYGFDASRVPWCDVFADYAFIACFGYDVATQMTYQTPHGYAACALSAKAYEDHGALFKKPEVGDQIFFNYDGGINHIGIVVDVHGEDITCVEGNYSNGVSLTKYNTRNQWIIAGYGRPDWSVVSDSGCPGDACDLDIFPKFKQEDWESIAKRMPKIEDGSIGNAVIALQAMLNFLGADLEVDGECGPLTLKEIREFKEGKL